MLAREIYKENRSEWENLFKKGIKYKEQLELDSVGYSLAAMKAKIKLYKFNKNSYISNDLVNYTALNLVEICRYLNDWE